MALGFDNYDINMYFPNKSVNKSINSYDLYSGRLVVRNQIDGRFLYDLDNFKKKGSNIGVRVVTNSRIMPPKGSANKASKNNIHPNNGVVNKNKKSSIGLSMKKLKDMNDNYTAKQEAKLLEQNRPKNNLENVEVNDQLIHKNLASQSTLLNTSDINKDNLTRKIVGYDYIKQRLNDNILIDNKNETALDIIDDLTLTVIKNKDYSETRQRLIDVAVNESKIKDSAINERAKEIRKYLNTFENKTFYVDSTATNLGYDSFTELN